MTTQQRFASGLRFFSPADSSGQRGSIGGRPARSFRSSGGRAVSENAGTRGARDARGRHAPPNAPAGAGTRGDGLRGGAGSFAGARARLRSKRAPRPCASRLLKKYLAVPTCRARSGKMTPDARSKRAMGRGDLADATEHGPVPGGPSRDAPLTRACARVSRSKRASVERRARSPSIPRETFTDAAPVPFPEESARPARSDDAPRARLASPFAIRNPGGTAPRLPPRHAHPRSPSLPSERRDAVRCAGTARARTGSVKAVGRSPRAFDRRSRSRSAVDRDRIGENISSHEKNPNLRFFLRGSARPASRRRVDQELLAFSIHRQPFFHDARSGSRVGSPDARRAEAVAQTTVTRTTLPLSARRSAPFETMASTTLNVAVPRAVATPSRARRGGMPPVRLASRRGVRCAAGEEVPLGVQIETALMDAFPPRYVGDRARAHPELAGRASPPRRRDASNQTLFETPLRRLCFFFDG